ncbi:restriction endonuclease subunit S [Enterococcus faecium]|nr:restriction endonuclease subunit S [Enterococcus faecium]EGP5493070.1 restriction endonuclease subunit S [Enterococcus faecium]
MSNDIQPEIRFPGFTEDWEERKFKDNIVSIQTGTNLLGSAVNEGTPLIKMGNLQRGYFSFKKLEYLDSNSNVGSEDIVNYGDFLFNTRNTLELVGKGATWTGISGKYAFNSNIARFKFDGIDTIFFNYLYNTQQVISQVHARAVGTTSVSAVYPRDLNSLLYYLPSIEEQQKIGTFFKNLDDTITLHQRKLDLLKETKKGFLQKMFPKNGAKVPEIRFSGFTEDWEQRKVGDFLNESRIKGSDGSVARKMTVKLWRKGVVPKEEIYSGSSATQYYIRKSGQFMYGKLDFLNQAFGIVPSELDGYESTLDSPAFDIGENMNSIFLLEYVSLTRFYKYQGNLANGSRRAKRIHVDTFLEMPIPTPSFEEQTKIGGFFKQLDDTITLHQRKLDLLKETKKGFLQKMFV